ncbi:hypothetical protein ACFSE0_11350 [Ochrobactrum teleogrylli]|uniref:Uncharacterized protein n=1 Tax=Ochrobactrum teleogrylli TaxID=2479765 RepID=A0ABY2XZ03_9HYPH|nr:hypothetical protein [[Ochrobactrum] teleogrylli]TNV10420.1 hypothetical protein FIC94_20230 [[Ochrobactrum] teleogrylli]
MDRKVSIMNYRTGHYVTVDGLIPGQHYWNIRMTPYCDKEKSAWFLSGSSENGVYEIYHKDIDGGQSVDVFLAKSIKLLEDSSSCGAIGSEQAVFGKTNFTLFNPTDVYYNISITDDGLKYYMKAPKTDIEKLIFVPDDVNITNENTFIIEDFMSR